MSYIGCVFEERCRNTENCEFCHYNPDACTKGMFIWNGEGEEPTREELNKEICS